MATSLLSSILTNNASAALMYPIAMEAVDQTGTDRLKMAYMVMLAANDYMTSFGYQTNLMVYAPGGYKSIEYVIFGGPLQFLLWITSVALVTTPAPWYVNWLICTALFVAVCVVSLTTSSWSLRKKSREPSENGNDVDEDSPYEKRLSTTIKEGHDYEFSA